MACPCGSARSYGGCCGLFHAGTAAPDAQALMRSRYSAYALALEAYLLRTWHPATRPASLRLAQDQSAVRWLGLKVVSHQVQDADHASVEFVARYRQGGAPAARLHERSRFVREDGCWHYLDGEFLA